MAGADQARREDREPGADIREGRESRPPEGRADRVEPFPRLVTVSREFGAGGARIAGRVAAELGFQLWDHELIAHLARKAGADLDALRELDERQRHLIEDVLASSLHGAGVSGTTYRALLTSTVRDLAERGGAVIVGRGASALVTAEQALRVRVVCPFKLRVERHAQREAVDLAVAERLVRLKDRERDRFERQLCGESTEEPSHFDLVINTAELSEELAARLVVVAYQSRFGRSAARDERRQARASL